VKHRAVRLSLVGALLLSFLISFAGPATRVAAGYVSPSEILVGPGELPAGFAPVDESGVASLLPDNLARQAAATFRRDSAEPGPNYVRQVVLAFDDRDATSYVIRFQTLMVKHQGYSVVSSHDAGFRLTRIRGEVTSAVAAIARGEMLIVTTVVGPAGTVSPDDAASLTRTAVARVPSVDAASASISTDPDRRTLANAQPGNGHLDIPNQQDADRPPGPVVNLPAAPQLSMAEARSQRPVGDASFDELMPIQHVDTRTADTNISLVQFTKSLEPLLNEFWSRFLSMTNIDFHPPRYVVLSAGEVRTTNCPGPNGRPLSARSLTYCPLDQTIYVYEPFIARQLLKGADWRNKDYVVVTYVAREWARHAQTLPLLPRLQKGETFNFDDDDPVLSRQSELQADCFTGVFTRYARDAGWLNAGDLDEAHEVMLRASDDSDPTLVHWASPEERLDWFTRGYVRYSFRDCEPW
jgi:predicted metalloprotease